LRKCLVLRWGWRECGRGGNGQAGGAYYLEGQEQRAGWPPVTARWGRQGKASSELSRILSGFEMSRQRPLGRALGNIVPA